MANNILVIIADKFWSFRNRLAQNLRCKMYNKTVSESYYTALKTSLGSGQIWNKRDNFQATTTDVLAEVLLLLFPIVTSISVRNFTPSFVVLVVFLCFLGVWELFFVSKKILPPPSSLILTIWTVSVH